MNLVQQTDIENLSGADVCFGGTSGTGGEARRGEAGRGEARRGVGNLLINSEISGAEIPYPDGNKPIWIRTRNVQVFVNKITIS